MGKEGNMLTKRVLGTRLNLKREVRVSIYRRGIQSKGRERKKEKYHVHEEKGSRAIIPAYDFTFLMRPSDSFTRCAHSLVLVFILVLVTTFEVQRKLCYTYVQLPSYTRRRFGSPYSASLRAVSMMEAVTPVPHELIIVWFGSTLWSSKTFRKASTGR